MKESESFFQTTVYAFLDWLDYHFPNDKHVFHSRTLLDHALSISGIRLVVLQYASYVLPFIDEVNAKNTHFFISLANDNMMGELDLKTKWTTLNDESKEILWTYIQQMTNLAMLAATE
jgi:hypothetical protein